MKISACYITKNEEKNLAKSIASIATVADEIIVVDTGSTDRTCEVAESCGAKVYTYEWREDFSGPRNFAIEQAVGDYILFMDADEYIAVSAHADLRKLLEQNCKHDALLMKRYDIDKDENDILGEIYVLRAFKHKANLRYYGRIHEELLDSGQTLANIAVLPSTEIIIYHTGYAAEVNQAKAERNLHILQEELKTTDNPGRLYMYLAEACRGVGDYAAMEHYARMDIAQGRQKVVFASRSYRMLLAYLAEQGRQLERYQMAVLAVKDFPELPEFHAELAECYAYAENYAGAYQAYERAVQAYENFHQGWEPLSLTEEQVVQIKKRMDMLKKQIYYPEQWTLARHEDILGLLKKNMADLSKVLPELIGLIIRLQQDEPSIKRDETLIRLTTYLPADYEAFWQYQLGLIDDAPANITDTYLTMLVYILQYGNEEQRHYYIARSLHMTAACFYKVINLLMEQERWRLAWSLLEQITADSDWIQAEYWYAAGVCLFYQQENAAALECFARAREAGLQNNEMESYITWAGEET